MNKKYLVLLCCIFLFFVFLGNISNENIPISSSEKMVWPDFIIVDDSYYVYDKSIRLSLSNIENSIGSITKNTPTYICKYDFSNFESAYVPIGTPIYQTSLHDTICVELENTFLAYKLVSKNEFIEQLGKR